MTLQVARPIGAPLDFQLDAVCGVYKAYAAAVHGLSSHGAKIDQKSEFIFEIELL